LQGEAVPAFGDLAPSGPCSEQVGPGRPPRWTDRVVQAG